MAGAARTDRSTLDDLSARLAAEERPVLLLGETGVGKSHLAELIIALSGRPARPAWRLGCVELEPTHPRRRSRQNVFAAARGGTLVLEEISLLAPPLQEELVRRLDAEERWREGRTRLIATSSADLPTLVARGLFRPDLLERLLRASVWVPPLRERKAEIAPLAIHFLEKGLRAAGRPFARIASGVLPRLERHPWPGNVRELRNVTRCAALICGDGIVEEAHLRPSLAAEGRAATAQERIRSVG